MFLSKLWGGGEEVCPWVFVKGRRLSPASDEPNRSILGRTLGHNDPLVPALGLGLLERRIDAALVEHDLEQKRREGERSG